MSMPIQMNDETYYNTEEAMKHLGVSRPTLNDLVATGKLNRYKQGIRKTIYYKGDELDSLLKIRKYTEEAEPTEES